MTTEDFTAAVWAAMAPILLLMIQHGARMLIDMVLRNALGEAAKRVAGDFIATNPEVRALMPDAVAAVSAIGASALEARFPGTVKRFGVTPETLRGMVRGEIGKLMAPANAAPPVG